MTGIGHHGDRRAAPRPSGSASRTRRDGRWVSTLTHVSGACPAFDHWLDLVSASLALRKLPLGQAVRRTPLRQSCQLSSSVSGGEHHPETSRLLIMRSYAAWALSSGHVSVMAAHRASPRISSCLPNRWMNPEGQP